MLVRDNKAWQIYLRMLGEREKRIRSKHTMYKSLGCRRAQYATTSDCFENRLQKAFSWMESMTLSVHGKRKTATSSPSWYARGFLARNPHSGWQKGTYGNSPSQLFFWPGEENIGFLFIKIRFPWDQNRQTPVFLLPFEKTSPAVLGVTT